MSISVLPEGSPDPGRAYGVPHSFGYAALLMLAVVILVSVPSFIPLEGSEGSDANNTIDYIEYKLDPNDRTASVAGYMGAPVDIVIPSTLTFESVEYEVVAVDMSAFSGCDTLKSVEISDGIGSIGSSAFYFCTSLETVTIPASVGYVGISAFYGCESLRSLSVSPSNDVYSSKDGVLFDKDRTTLLVYPAGKTATRYSVPAGVTSIEPSAFYGCASLKSVSIAKSVISIGNGAFQDCTSLSSVTIPEGVAVLGPGSFFGCVSLKSVTVPDSVTSTGPGMFTGCTSLETVVLGNGVPSISESVFQDCTSLSSVTLGNSLASIGSSSFRDCTSLASITIPDSVTFIGNAAFQGCTSLSSVTLGNSLVSISYDVFYGCTSLLSITIPDSVTFIGNTAFADHTFYDTDGITVLDKTADVLAGYKYVGQDTSKMVRQSNVTVTFDKNGGYGEMDVQTMFPGVPMALNANTFEKDGSHFVSWNTKADGSGTSYKDGEVVSLEDGTTLYAQWSSDYTIPQKIGIAIFFGIAIIKQLFRLF